MEKKCRRVVTGFNKQGDSVVISESFVNNQMEKNSRPGVSLNNIWHIFNSMIYDFFHYFFSCPPFSRPDCVWNHNC